MDIIFVLWMILLAACIACASVYARLKQWHACLAWCVTAGVVFWNTINYHDAMNNLSYDALQEQLNTCRDDVHNCLSSVHKCVHIKSECN